MDEGATHLLDDKILIDIVERQSDYEQRLELLREDSNVSQHLLDRFERFLIEYSQGNRSQLQD